PRLFRSIVYCRMCFHGHIEKLLGQPHRQWIERGDFLRPCAGTVLEHFWLEKLVDQVGLRGFLAGEYASGQQNLFCQWVAHGFLQPPQRARTSDDAEVRLWLAEFRAGRGNPEICCQCELQAATQSKAVDGCNDWCRSEERRVGT